jgi:hypothetical protein
MSIRAMERLGQLLDSEDERVAMVAANAILDRAYGKPKESKETPEEKSLSLQGLSPSVLARLRSVMAEIVAAQALPAPDGPEATDGATDATRASSALPVLVSDQSQAIDIIE